VEILKQTDNLALNLPEGADNYNVDDYNENFEVLDAKITELEEMMGGVSITSIREGLTNRLSLSVTVSEEE
jgi:hypothetical protein